MRRSGAGGRVELDGAADAGGGQIFVGHECERQVAVGGEGHGVGGDLRAGVVADHYGDIHGLRRDAVDRDAGGGAAVLSKARIVAVGVAAFERHYGLLTVGVVAEDYKSSHVAVGCELGRADGRRGIR